VNTAKFIYDLINVRNLDASTLCVAFASAETFDVMSRHTPFTKWRICNSEPEDITIAPTKVVPPKRKDFCGKTISGGTCETNMETKKSRRLSVHLQTRTEYPSGERDEQVYMGSTSRQEILREAVLTHTENTRVSRPIVEHFWFHNAQILYEAVAKADIPSLFP